MPKKNTFVFDSYALIGYLEDEPFAEWIQQILLSAQKGHCKLILNALQLGEVYYIIFKEQGKQLADAAYARIKFFPISLLETIDEKLLLSAATIKASFPVSYADAFAAATAINANAILLTGDPEFMPLEKKGILKVKWLK